MDGHFLLAFPHGPPGSSPLFLITVLSMVSILFPRFQPLAFSSASYGLNSSFLLPHYFIISSALSLLLKLESVSLLHFFSAKQFYPLPFFPHCVHVSHKSLHSSGMLPSCSADIYANLFLEPLLSSSSFPPDTARANLFLGRSEHLGCVISVPY